MFNKIVDVIKLWDSLISLAIFYSYLSLFLALLSFEKHLTKVLKVKWSFLAAIVSSSFSSYLGNWITQ